MSAYVYALSVMGLVKNLIHLAVYISVWISAQVICRTISQMYVLQYELNLAVQSYQCFLIMGFNLSLKSSAPNDYTRQCET